MSMNLVIKEDLGPVAVLTINRPERRNALSRLVVSTLSDQFSEVARNHHTRAVIVSGAGSVFCSGVDLHEALHESGEAGEQQAIRDSQALADLLDLIHQFPKPTIAALNGDAFAGGAGLAMACDFVIAAQHTRICYPELKVGLIPAIVLHDLTRQIGGRRARQLLLGGDVISATDAMSWGLINKVVPGPELMEEAEALGRNLAQLAPHAMASTKRLLDEASHRPRDLRGAAAISAAQRVSIEGREGIAAFLQKRAPRWLETVS